MKRQLQRDRPPPLLVDRPPTKKQNRRPLMVVQTQALQYRQPLIIHTFSPEVIQTEAHNFMGLVQSLTGQGSHVSPPIKKPRRGYDMQHLSRVPRPIAVSLNEQLLGPVMSDSASRIGPSRARSQEEQTAAEDLALRRGSYSPLPRLGTGSSPHNRLIQGGISLLSPGGFEFSPSILPSPTTFLRDFPSLLSPGAAGLPSSRLARSPAIPAALRSPGPLTTAFYADLPALSPAASAYRWIEKLPLSVEPLLSPGARALRWSPRAPSSYL